MDVSPEKDYLTEVYLRAAFVPYLQGLILESEGAGKAFSLVFMDLDHFKKINDNYGHPFGDEVLKYIGSSLRLSFQGIPSRVFRYGGDEFILVFPGTIGREAQRLVQLLRSNLDRRPILYKNKLFKVTSSYGIASYPADGKTVEALLKQADIALYFSKHRGRNVVSQASEVPSRQVVHKTIVLTTLAMCLLFAWVNWQFLRQNFQEAVRITSLMVEQVREIDLDMVLLNDGTIMRGKIQHETDRTLTIQYKTTDGLESFYAEKSEVKRKTYGLKTPKSRRYDETRRQNPNPHY
ncbi:MAG: GGDEF domain-containing protein [Candidatus Omnitrophica bacterium]|nr:GGDEF domain-containing protein [Candidatus Omnitrophota bacterium]